MPYLIAIPALCRAGTCGNNGRILFLGGATGDVGFTRCAELGCSLGGVGVTAAATVEPSPLDALFVGRYANVGHTEFSGGGGILYVPATR